MRARFAAVPSGRMTGEALARARNLRFSLCEWHRNLVLFKDVPPDIEYISSQEGGIQVSAKVKVKNVKAVRTSKSRKAKVSNEALGGVSSGHSCCNRRDGAVEGIQEAGADLSDLFCQLKNPVVAAKLVRAIRCRNRKVIEELIGANCEVVCFFHQGRFACVRIACVFGNCCDVRISFDICVSQGNCRNQF